LLERLLYADLLNWRLKPERKPVLLDGARQVGKTWLIEQLFGSRQFRKVHKLDFRAEPGLADLFLESLEPRAIISKIELRLNRAINIEKDLIIFDEVGECQPAVDSLKYFAENLPQAFVCASGSNIGLLDSFPVGKVQQLELFPLCFEEFIMASGQTMLLKAFREQEKSQAVHQLLWSQLLDYYFVGGMPEAVASWFKTEASTHTRVHKIVQIHADLIAGYQRDFGKYAGKYHAQHIEAVFHNVPRQLAATQDGSVQRFKFKGVIEKKRRYRELQGPIDWLEKASLVWKCYPIDSKPEAPLPARVKANIFKLYLFDVGLLGHMLGMTYADQRDQRMSHKGYIAENFVLTELRARVAYRLYSWEQARAEVEFLHRCNDGEVIPVEVKSGKRTQARSLRSFIDRYAPTRAIKLIGGLGGNPDGTLQVWPLYYAQYLRDL
jgi:predicted AAA+ superfamily ATPase